MDKQVEQPPQSIEAESSVLGAIVLKGEEIFDRVVPWIRDNSAFYSNDNKIIWEAIKDCLETPAFIASLSNLPSRTSNFLFNS